MRRDADWSRIAALYADENVSLEDIARLTGVPVGTISARAAREGWPPRNRTRLDSRRATTTYGALLRRMFRAVDRQMREIEKHLDTAERSGRPAAGLAQDARALDSLTRILERLRAMQRAAAAEASARVKRDGRGRDPEAHRDELERRLAGLLAALGETGVPEQPE